MNCCRPSSMTTSNPNNNDDDDDNNMIVIPDNHNATTNTSTETLIYPKLYQNHFESLLIPYSQIHQRTKQIALSISQHYKNKTNNENGEYDPLVIICILKGSNPFYNLLLSELSLLSVPYILEFIRVKSYVGNSSSGNIQIFNQSSTTSSSSSSNDPTSPGNGIPKSVKGRNVLLVEDIVDTGMTLQKLIPIVQEYGLPKSLNICTLLIKRLSTDHNHENDSNNGRSKKVVPKYVGFSIPDHFVVGFGLDYNEMYRDLRDIWILGAKGIELGGYGDL